jgi:hypothetical protein
VVLVAPGVSPAVLSPEPQALACAALPSSTALLDPRRSSSLSRRLQPARRYRSPLLAVVVDVPVINGAFVAAGVSPAVLTPEPQASALILTHKVMASEDDSR